MKKFFTAVVALIVIGIIIAGVVGWLRSTDNIPGAPDSNQAGPTQPEWCPRVEVIAAPGTWESASVDDPLNPMANPNSLMLTITNPLKQRYPHGDIKIWTLPYTAQFRNINAQQEMSYDDSRNEGMATLKREINETHRECPLTEFILTGFSQGAVIMGDLANEIGVHETPIPSHVVRGVALIADGRRQPGVGQAVGTPVGGVGAEISLAPLNLVVQPIVPGATMRGPRTGGFGVLNDRVFDICAPDDTICDAPQNVNDAFGRAFDLIEANGIHAQYATNPNVVPGTTAPSWVVEWASDLINRG
ncbi:cutinase family protein [Corynebacterium sp. ES2715-CONJ3]|uniref:cutinase family protein n=1 Tax=Corynebacterium sp. ES2715-CONJ3 TaxID=2974028 RepID=UPI00216931B2|nr:cutinase family protein [Corynebacterium sp. ES2715-CONJ3]MCS4492056.1 cutinase family protein [Corynebacterium sp. ES2715-CONJ3]